MLPFNLPNNKNGAHMFRPGSKANQQHGAKRQRKQISQPVDAEDLRRRLNRVVAEQKVLEEKRQRELLQHQEAQARAEAAAKASRDAQSTQENTAHGGGGATITQTQTANRVFPLRSRDDSAHQPSHLVLSVGVTLGASAPSHPVPQKPAAALYSVKSSAYRDQLPVLAAESTAKGLEEFSSEGDLVDSDRTTNEDMPEKRWNRRSPLLRKADSIWAIKTKLGLSKPGKQERVGVGAFKSAKSGFFDKFRQHITAAY
ncbi:hypothetical protein BX600DRAFT_145004 [Xylariales sp. PMI_506]|nr:hypothetical protein BX600DRAFT_145004 [Xylariales sp. PMI_506]